MSPFESYRRWIIPLGLAVAAGFFSCQGSPAQSTELLPDFSRCPTLPRDWTYSRATTGLGDGTSTRTDRFLLFRMPTGYLKDPVGLDLEDDSPPGVSASTPSASDAADGFNWIQLSLGSDNPYFDFRRSGDPGGLGYYRMSSQMRLVDTGKTGCNFMLGAATPMGLESEGLANGPTFFSPAFACYRELWEGTTVQAFVGKHLRANSRWAGEFGHSIQYGIAAHHPLPDLPFLSSPGANPNLFVFVEALGRCRMSFDDRTSQQISPLELLPGLHWRVTENWWFTGGLVIPLNAPRPEGRLWQLTCSWRF
jgi:hypothetical protein